MSSGRCLPSSWWWRFRSSARRSNPPLTAKFSGGIGTLGRLWWPDWKNPLIWLLGLTFGSNNSPFFGANAFLGDYLATKGETGVLGLALASLNGAQILALGFLIVMADRMQRRAWPFLLFGPVMLAGFLGLIFLPSPVAIVVSTGLIGISTALTMTPTLALPALLVAPSDVPRTAAGMFTISYTCAIIIPTICGALVGRDREAVDRLRAVGALRGGAHGDWRHHRAPSSAG